MKKVIAVHMRVVAGAPVLLEMLKEGNQYFLKNGETERPIGRDPAKVILDNWAKDEPKD
jgi:hypothetical protein